MATTACYYLKPREDALRKKEIIGTTLLAVTKAL